ncbi:MAG: hypothetical protein WAK60_09250 [Sedimentisphaerales bacterium]
MSLPSDSEQPVVSRVKLYRRIAIPILIYGFKTSKFICLRRINSKVIKMAYATAKNLKFP